MRRTKFQQTTTVTAQLNACFKKIHVQLCLCHVLKLPNSQTLSPSISPELNFLNSTELLLITQFTNLLRNSH